MPDHKLIELDIMASTTISTAGSTSPQNVERYTEACIYADVTTRPGTETLALTIEDCPDDDPTASTAQWYTHTAFSSISAIGNYVTRITNIGKWLRITYTPSSTGGWVFSLKGIAKT